MKSKISNYKLLYWTMMFRQGSLVAGELLATGGLEGMIIDGLQNFFTAGE